MPVFCGFEQNARGRPLGSRNKCFKKGIGVGIGIGEEKGVKRGEQHGLKRGKVLGELKGRKKGEKIGVRKLTLGHSLTLQELNSLSKDSLRNILANRKRKRITSFVGSVSLISKDALKNAVEADLRRTHKLRI